MGEERIIGARQLGYSHRHDNSLAWPVLSPYLWPTLFASSRLSCGPSMSCSQPNVTASSPSRQQHGIPRDHSNTSFFLLHLFMD